VADIERSFFTLVYDQRPDVIVLDTRGPRQNGITAIRKIHEKTEIPILAICEANDSLQRQYRIVGRPNVCRRRSTLSGLTRPSRKSFN
jgi:DNA-binding response OmpR family regulator